jgi:archaellum component FlaC
MKKLVAILLVVAFASCTNKEQEEKIKQLEQDNLKLQEQIGGDANTINDFVNAYNEIQYNLDSIKAKEGIITANTANGVEMGADRKEQITQDIQLIYELSLKNRKKIDELNKKLKDEKGYTGNLKKMIENLEKQLAERDAQINVLKDELAKLDIVVENLTAQVDMLATESEGKSKVIDEKVSELNTAYYIVGTEKALKESKIITKEGGFIGMGRTANINKDFDQNLFTKVDVTKTGAIAINAKKAKIVTDHPTSSYTLHADKKKADSLSINDYKAFWRSSKYLVIVAE